MKHTVIALFDHAAHARQAAEALVAQGFEPSRVHVAADGAASAETHPLPPAAAIEGGPASGLLHRLAVLFGVSDEPHISHYEEAVRRGGSLVGIEADSEAQATAARDALLALGAVNIDDRVEDWQRAGWSAAVDRDAARSPASPVAAATRAGETAAFTGEPRTIAVHKQEVSIRGVRVYGSMSGPAADRDRAEESGSRRAQDETKGESS
jgi:hypothetical protein